MAIPTLIELAESGAHFGHHRSLTYPKARKFVFAVKSNVALIDLEKTQEAIAQAQKVIQEYQAAGKHILFVGTKRSIRHVVKEVAEAIGASYITERWFGGTLTNFTTIKESIKRMDDLETFLAGPKAAQESKKERLTHSRRLARYRRFLQGLSGLKAMPDLVVLASARVDGIAIAEANQLEIPVMAISDTDMNPDRVTYPIPANDDAPKAIELILHAIVQSANTPKSKPVIEEKEVTVEKPAKAAVVKEKKAVKATKKTATKKPAAKKVAKAKK